MKDLHIHTKYSDGEFDEEEILKEINNAGIDEFAICDHDTIDGSKRVNEVLKAQNFNVIFHSGVELTCRLNGFENGVNMHILFYDFDYNNKELLEVLAEISQLRYNKIAVMVEYVEKFYNITIPKDKLEEKIKNTKAFAKPHLYSIMQAIGNFDREQYYRTMDKLDTSKLKLDSAKTIQKLKGKGKLVLAHPVEIMKEYNYDINKIEQIIAELKRFGLNGVETHHSSQTKQLQEQLSKIAKKYGLFETHGSDFHGPTVKPGLKVGDIFAH